MTASNAEPNADTPPPARKRRWIFQVAAVGLIGISALAGTGLAWLLRPDEPATAGGLRLPDKLEVAFTAWGKRKPDVVLLLSGEQHGYVLPCGCSEPQVGGLERRYNLVRLLKARGWPIVAVDLGNIAQKEGIQGPVGLQNLQGVPKYVVSMKALQAMGYTAVGLGEYEAALSFEQVLSHFALNEPQPRVLAANIRNADALFPEQLKSWTEGVEVDASTPGALPIKVGVTTVIGLALQKKIKEPNVQFEDVTPALRRVLAEMDAANVGLRVLLYQGPVNGAARGEKPHDAVACARYFPQLNVILCLSDTDLPPAMPVEVGQEGHAARTQVISVGHKGKHVGVLGVWRTGKQDPPFEFKYQLVELTPDFVAPKEQRKDNPVLDRMEEYTLSLKNAGYLAKYSQKQHVLQVMAPVAGLKNPGEKDEPTYVGSETCNKCHKNAYKIWKDSKHSHAYQTLVEAIHPSNRQYDAECIVCHTVGFGYQGGFRDADKTPLLKNVGCESCHGPGSLHVKNHKNREWQKRMNLNWWKDPEKEEAPAQKAHRLDKIDMFCQKCHDTDNDVTWTNGAFKKKWAQIAHPTLPDE
jgi:hypothetical protein